jgi:hypothetical protein
MTVWIRTHVFWLISIVTVLLLSTIALPRALGQSPSPDGPELWRVPPRQRLLQTEPGPDGFQADQGLTQSDLVTPVPLLPPDAPVGSLATPGACDLDYWIVSSRHCPQSKRGFRQRCRLQYLNSQNGFPPHHSDSQTFRHWLQPGVPLCILVHGSFSDWEGTLYDVRHVYRWLRNSAPDRPLQMVVFSWPGDRLRLLLPHMEVAILGRRSGYNGLYLAQLVSEIPADQPVTLFGHSHGARTVASALHLLAGGDVRGIRFGCRPPEGQRIRVVLAAAALDDHWFNPGERFGRALCRTEHLLNLRNREDIALSFYRMRRLFSHGSLARSGFTRRSLRAMGPHTGKISDFDVTSTIRTGHLLHNYYRRPEIGRAIAPFVYFFEADHKLETEFATDQSERAQPPRPRSADSVPGSKTRRHSDAARARWYQSRLRSWP